MSSCPRKRGMEARDFSRVRLHSEEELKKYMANKKSGEGKRGTFEDMFGDLFS